MSESMAFIGGVAVAGLAALLLLKGAGGNAIQNFSASSPQAQAPVVAPPAIPPAAQYNTYVPQNPSSSPGNFVNEQLRSDMDRMKLQIESMQRENDRLKSSNDQLQTQINHQYQTQLKAFNPHNLQNAPQQAALAPAADNDWWSSGVLWGAVGGMALTIGGGVVVAGVSALFSQKPRASRTVQVIHPYSSPNPTLTPVRRAEFLPPRQEQRRTEVPEYEDMY